MSMQAFVPRLCNVLQRAIRACAAEAHAAAAAAIEAAAFAAAPGARAGQGPQQGPRPGQDARQARQVSPTPWPRTLSSKEELACPITSSLRLGCETALVPSQSLQHEHAAVCSALRSLTRRG